MHIILDVPCARVTTCRRRTCARRCGAWRWRRCRAPRWSRRWTRASRRWPGARVPDRSRASHQVERRNRVRNVQWKCPIKYTSDISAHHSRSVPLNTLLPVFCYTSFFSACLARFQTCPCSFEGHTWSTRRRSICPLYSSVSSAAHAAACLGNHRKIQRSALLAHLHFNAFLFLHFHESDQIKNLRNFVIFI